MNTPILKWPGGKQWVSELISSILAAELYKQYYEPFLGGAAVFLKLSPNKAYLSDINEDLIHFYQIVCAKPKQVVDRARQFGKEEDDYYRVRKSKPRTDVGRAARFFYLNKTCWGGIYRENQRGEFNVPYGFYDRKICSKSDVLVSAKAFGKATLQASDFAVSFLLAGKGDVVFADPPYTSKGQFNGFVRYNETLFSWEDQLRLCDLAKKARNRGAFVMVCGSFHRDVLGLYENWWTLKTERISGVRKDSKKKKPIYECLIMSRKPQFQLANLERISNDFIESIPQLAH